RQAAGVHLDLALARQRRVGELREQRQVDDMVGAELGAPVDESLEQLRANVQARLELDQMALPVVEADRLDVGVAFERVRQADRGVLPTGEENERVARIKRHAALPARARSTSAT